MQLIGKSEVTKLNAKAGIVYPLIRLLKIYASEIGKTAEIFDGRCSAYWDSPQTFKTLKSIVSGFH